MSKGSTQVKQPDPFAIAEADALFNRINQFTPLSSLQYFGPQRNNMVETLNPALQYAENQRLLSDIGLNNMALSRQADMKGGSLPSLTPNLQPGAQQDFFGLPTNIVTGTDPAITPPQVPDFIGQFQQPSGGVPGGVPGGTGLDAPNYVPGLQPNEDGGPIGGEAWDAFTKYDPSGRLGRIVAKNDPIAKALGLDDLFGEDLPKRGKLPGTEWVRNDAGKIIGTGHGHWNPQLGMYVDRRGRPKSNQAPPPQQPTTAPQQPYAGVSGGTLSQSSPGLINGANGGSQPLTPQMSGGLQAPQMSTGLQYDPQQFINQQGGQGPQMSTGLQYDPAQFMNLQGGQGPQMSAAQSPQQSNGGLFGGSVGGLIDPNTFGQIGDLAGLADFDLDRGRVEQATFGRAASLLNPQFDQEEQRMVADLRARGIPRDSEAFEREMANFRRSKGETFGRLGMDSVLAGGGEQSRLFGLSSALGDRSQNAISQMFGMGERLAERDILTQMQNANIAQANRATQFNELASLLGLNQVAQPGLQNFFAPGQVDVGGAFALNQQAQTTNANNNAAMKGGAMDALGGLGGAALLSDRRLKKNVERIGTIKGYPLYSFEYLWDEPSIGVMSDEIPEEYVIRGADGYDRVDYGRLINGTVNA